MSATNYINPFQEIANVWKAKYWAEVSVSATLRDSHLRAAEILETAVQIGEITGNLEDVSEPVRRLAGNLRKAAEVVHS